MVKEGKVVRLAYTLKNSEGEIVDQADSGEPLEYLHGANEIVPGLERGLEGMEAGDKKSLTVGPDEGYGEINPELKLVVQRSQFPPDMKVEEGMRFETSAPDGGDLVFTVDAIQGSDIHIDANHPLAGETLHFEVEVVDVRDATEEEMAHGHAHGEGGHGDEDGHDGHEHTH